MKNKLSLFFFLFSLVLSLSIFYSKSNFIAMVYAQEKSTEYSQQKSREEFSASSTTMQSEIITVQDSVKSTLLHSPLLQSKYATRQSAENKVREAKSGYYPTIGLWAGAGVSQETSYDTRSYGTHDTPVGIAEIGMNLNYTLYDAGLTSSKVRSQEASYEASLYDVIDSASNLAFSTLSAHADILRYKEIVRLTQKYIQEHKSILFILQARYDKGLSTRGELDQVLGRLHQAEATLLAYEEALYNAELSYTRLTGIKALQKLMPLEMPKKTYAHYEEVQHVSTSKNYYLKALLAIVESLENIQNSVKSGLAPKVSLSTGPSYTSQDNSADKDIFAWNAMVNVEWSVFDGGSTRATLRASADDVLAAKKNYREAKDVLYEQIKITFRRVSTAQKQAILYAKADKENKRARDNFFLQFEAGKKDLLSILDAETASFTASISNVVALTDAILGEYQLHALAGTLLANLDIDDETLGLTNTREEHIR